MYSGLNVLYEKNTTAYQYDLLGRVIKKINPDLTEREAVYDDANSYVTIYDELDHFIKRYYDGLNRLQTIEWYKDGQLYTTETYTYDYLDNLTTKIDPGGHVYNYEYDSKGRTTKMVNPDGDFKLVEFDDVNARVKITDENGHFKRYQYDWAQRLVSIEECTDSVSSYLTQYEYDQAGNLVHLINGNGETVILEYDSLFGPTLATYPDGTSRSLTYDKKGNILTKTDGNGTTIYTYDTVYQQIEIKYADQKTVQFEYDPNGNYLSVINDYSAIMYTYDNQNRLISTAQQVSGENYTFTYDYDVAGRLTSLTYPDGTILTRTYDDLNRLTSIDTYADFSYKADSLLETVTYGNGVVTTYSYDQCQRPLSITTVRSAEELLHLIQYTYDAVGNVMQLINTWLNPLTQVEETTTTSFGYDALDRLISASNGFDTISFSYDAMGNRIQQILNGETTDYSYLPYDKLVTAGQWTFAYDAVGNTLSKTNTTDQWIFQYDKTNRLSEIHHNDQHMGTYFYDGNDRRIKKIEWNPDSQQNETIIYIYSQGRICYERNLTTGFEAIYIYGPEGRIAKRVGEDVIYYHIDHLGSTRLLTDEAGNPVTAVEYQPFGGSEITGNGERYLFTGQEMDFTGLYYYSKLLETLQNTMAWKGRIYRNLLKGSSQHMEMVLRIAQRTLTKCFKTFPKMLM